ncbi:MAG: hypothetical protein ACYC4L_03635 [Chloroflexota bacterium]
MRAFVRRNALLLALAVLGLLGLLAAVGLQEYSFPLARVEFRLLRDDAESVARAYLHDRGFAVDGYQTAVAFEIDNSAKGYVERQAGLPELNRLAAADLSVWRWHVRFYREWQQEEYSVYLSPDGRPVGFSHHLPEATAGARPSQSEAEARAVTLLRAGGRDPADYRLITASAQQRPGRTDHFFTWESQRFALADATYRLDVWTQGDNLGGWREYVRVPEEWRRQQAMEANRGALLANIGWTLTYALGLAMALVALLRLRAGRLHWRFALSLAALMLAIAVAVALNTLPLVLMEYPTTASLAAYLLGRLQSQAFTFLPTGLAVVLAGVAGDWLYSLVLRHRLAPHLLFSRRGALSSEFATAVLAGYAVAGIWLAYVTIFYTVASRWFGAWSPAEVPYRDLMSTLAPALYPLTVGFGAAISEEFIFRLFAVPLGLWLLWGALARWPVFSGRPAALRFARVLATVVAVVLPAFVWGTLHSTYPQQPFYARAVEVGLIGCLDALVMWRFGILATIIAHYTYNASVIGGLFLLSPSWYLRISAVVVVLLPLALLLPAVRRVWRRQRLYGHEELAEAAPALPPLESTPVVAPSSEDWRPARARPRELLALGAVALALALLWQVPRLGDGLRIAIDGDEVAARSAAVLDELGLGETQWQSVTSLGDWSQGNHTTYLLRRLGTAATNRFLQGEEPGWVWTTRFYRPVEKEELHVRFAFDGQFHSLQRLLPEDGPGARLPEGEARALAESFARSRGEEAALSGRLAVAESVARQGRTDHTFEWESEDPRLDEATRRLRVVVQGDQLGEFRSYLKTPEAFDRFLARRGAGESALDLLRQLLSSVVYFGALVIFTLRFRRGQLDLRFAAAWAGVLAALSLLGELNRLPIFWTGYWTTIDAAGYVVWRLIEIARDLGGQGVWYFVLFAVGESLYRERFPNLAPLGTQWRAFWQGKETALSAGAVALVAAPALWLLLAAYRWAREAFAWQFLVAEGTVPAYLFNTYLPGLEVVRSNLHFGLWIALGALPTTLWLYARLRRRWAVLLVWLAVLTVLYAGRPEEWQRNLVEAARWLGFLALVHLAGSRWLGPNIWAYALALYTFQALREALFLAQQPRPDWLLAGIIALALAVLPALALVWRGLAGRGTQRRHDAGSAL